MRESNISWVDTHCHLENSIELGDVLIGTALAGVSRLINVGTDIGTSLQVLNLTREISAAKKDGLSIKEFLNRHFNTTDEAYYSSGDGAVAKELDLPDVWAALGVHPHDAKNGIDPLYDLLSGAAKEKNGLPGSVVAIGECGLDYYYNNSSVEDQKEVFARQIDIANDLALALVIHTRDAWEDTFAILKEHKMPVNTIIHCFTGGVEQARKALDMGAYISFSGIVTFKNALAIQEAAKFCPLDRILIETDSPYLAPVPHRGKKNQPAFVSLVGEYVATLKGVDSHDFSEQVMINATKVFSLS